MAERPPAGYEKRDKPLPHNFTYKFGLKADEGSDTQLCATLLRTSTNSVDPKTIEVNPRNSVFVVDTGPLICFDSIVQMMTIRTSMSLTEGFIYTDKVAALAVYDHKIFGAFEDAWTPTDEKTGASIENILNVTSNAGTEDVEPENSGANIASGGLQPLSNITGVEVFGDYGLSTDATLQANSTAVNYLDEIFDAKQYYTNGAKLNTMMGRVNRHILTHNRPIATMSEKRFTPRSVRFGNPHSFFAQQTILPSVTDTAQVVGPGDTLSNITHVGVTIDVRFNEWNKDFDQSRM